MKNLIHTIGYAKQPMTINADRILYICADPKNDSLCHIAFAVTSNADRILYICVRETYQEILRKWGNA
jgi:hypothetical protein